MINSKKGRYENTIGTTVFLNGDDESPDRGQLDSMTEKKLVFTRCLLSKKEEQSDFFTGNEIEEEGMFFQSFTILIISHFLKLVLMEHIE